MTKQEAAPTATYEELEQRWNELRDQVMDIVREMMEVKASMTLLRPRGGNGTPVNVEGATFWRRQTHALREALELIADTATEESIVALAKGAVNRLKAAMITDRPE